MLPSFLLSLREGLEIALIIGIVLGALRKVHRSDLKRVVWSGVLSATVISAITAFILHSMGAAFEGPAEQIFEGFTMLLAAGVLTWMIFWMSRQSRHIKSDLEAGVRRAILKTGKRALFLLALVAVLREGIELSLFITAAAMAAGTQQTLWGTLIGLSASIVIGWLLFATTVRLNLSQFFRVTGVLLILFAAGLVAHGVHEFNEVGWIPSIIEHVWNTNFILDENSVTGQMLQALFGYNGNPSLTEVLAYAGYFIAILLGLRWYTGLSPVVREPQQISSQ
ncbi:MAG: FTR1 family protein [Anaerolineales bacterium]